MKRQHFHSPDKTMTAPTPIPITPPAASVEPFIDKKEVGRRLGIKPRTLDEWMKRGLLVRYKIARSVRFKWSEVEAHLAATCRVCHGAK